MMRMVRRWLARMVRRWTCQHPADDLQVLLNTDLYFGFPFRCGGCDRPVWGPKTKMLRPWVNG